MVAAVGACAVMCTAATGFAANTVSIESVSILDSESSVVNTYTDDLSNISLDPSQLLEVTVKLSIDTEETAIGDEEVTFLSHLALGDTGEALGNSNIQYIDQKAVDGEGKAVVRFRPRMTIGENGAGSFVAMTGGTGVEQVGSFNYTVASAKKAMTLTNTGTGSVQDTDDTTDLQFTVVADPLPESLTVKIDNDTVEAVFVKETGVLTISNANINKAVGTHTVTVSAEGYLDASANYVVTHVDSPITDKDAAQAALDNMVIPEMDENKTVTMPATVPVAEDNFTVHYEAEGTLNGVTLSGNKLTLDDGVFAAKATVNAYLGEKAQGISRQITVYLVPSDTTVSYGNIGLYQNGSGADAFANDADFSAALSSHANDLLADRVTALNITLGRGETTDVPQFTQTLDYDQDGKIVLAEYRIFKLMLEGDENYTPTKIKAARADWLANHPNN